MSHRHPEHIGRSSAGHASAGHAALGAAALVALAGAASAGLDNRGVGLTYTWQATAPGESPWAQPANWLSIDGGVPGPDDLALFDGNSGLGLPPYGAFLTATTQVQGLSVLDVQTTIELRGNQLFVSGGVEGFRELLVGGSTGARLVVEGPGLLRSSLARVGDALGADSMLELNGTPGALAHEHLSPLPFIVGQLGSGTLDLVTATLKHSGAFIAGEAPGSRAVIDLRSGSQLKFGYTTPSSVVFGEGGEAYVSVFGPSMVSSGPGDSLRLGALPSSIGHLSFFTLGMVHPLAAQSVIVGELGEGLLRISQGAIVEMTPVEDVLLGAGESGSGEARVVLGGFWSVLGPPVRVGPGGSGTLSIGETAQVFAPAGVIAHHDGVVTGSGRVGSAVTLLGGEIAPTARWAETPLRQQLRVDGDLDFAALRPDSDLPETGRMTFTLISPDPAVSMSVVVHGAARLNGTLRVRLEDTSPLPGAWYPVVEAASLSGVFDAVQSPARTLGLVAVPIYPGDGKAYVEFVPDEAPPPDLDAPSPFSISGAFTDARAQDVNNDGFPDLIAVATNGPAVPGSIIIARNLGVDTGGNWLGFSPAPQAFSTEGREPVAVAVGDLNLDQNPDIVVLNRGETSQHVRIRLNDPANIGEFADLDPRTVTVAGAPVDLTLADINGSGRLDIITVYEPAFFRGAGGGGVNTSEDDGGGFDDNDGGNGDDPGSVDTMGGEFSPVGVAVTSKNAESVNAYGTGLLETGRADRGVFPLFLEQVIPTGRDPEDLFTEDLDGDGLDEIVTSDLRSGTISVIRARSIGAGDLTYDDAVSLRASENGIAAQPIAVVPLDVNGDGRTDIVYIANDPQAGRRVHAILNLGVDAGSDALLFGRAEVLPTDIGSGPPPTILAVADLDQNGRDDLVTLSGLESGGPGVQAFLALGDGPCNPADLSLPYGVLDLGDLGAFIAAFVAHDPVADLAPPFGLFDLSDIGLFVTAFTGGCP